MDQSGVTLLIAAPLRFFLAPTRRRAELVLPCDGSSTVGHLLTSLRVPKTEVGGLVKDGRPVGADYRPHPGEVISVEPVSRPQAAPTSPPRFVLDVHLGTLARRMRLLGLDTAYEQDAADDALLQTSLTEQRILLTRDRGLLHRRALRWGAHVSSQAPDEQLHEVLDRFDPPLQPWTRCPRCNRMLYDAAKDQVEERLPEGTRRCYDTFRQCGSCGQVYWLGAHGDALRRIVDATTGR